MNVSIPPIIYRAMFFIFYLSLVLSWSQANKPCIKCSPNRDNLQLIVCRKSHCRTKPSTGDNLYLSSLIVQETANTIRGILQQSYTHMPIIIGLAIDRIQTSWRVILPREHWQTELGYAIKDWLNISFCLLLQHNSFRCYTACYMMVV